MAVSAKVEEIIQAIKDDPSDTIIAATYTWAFRNRASVSAAFRIAKERGIIRVAYQSVAGTPVWTKEPAPPAPEPMPAKVEARLAVSGSRVRELAWASGTTGQLRDKATNDNMSDADVLEVARGFAEFARSRAEWPGLAEQARHQAAVLRQRIRPRLAVDNTL